MEKGGDISRNLMSLYVYFNEELMDATISHDKTKIEFVLSKVDELAEAWRTIASSTANECLVSLAKCPKFRYESFFSLVV